VVIDVFDEIRECLDRYEELFDKPYHLLTDEEIDIVQFFEMYLAKAIMRDFKERSESIAKIILAYLGVSNEIKIKIE
jgi:hypothetical protein